MKKNISLILFSLLCFNNATIETRSVQTFYSPNPSNPSQTIISKTIITEDSVYNSSQIRLIQFGILATTASLIIANNYIQTVLLVKEEYLVKNKFPFAQEWYDALNVKHPEAELDKKLFLQEMRGIPAKMTSWCSTFNDIYFPQESLKEINTIYKKKMNNEEITKEEETALCKEEFILLHEAGHIQHNDIRNRLCCLFGVNAALIATLDNSKNNVGTYYLAMIATLIGTSRFQESNADNFACENSDINALEGGITFFENEEVDPLFNIENKKNSPFIPAEYSVGKLIQCCYEFSDEFNLLIFKTIKKLSISRWTYDFMRAPTHPGPSARAQKLRDTIAARQQAAL